MLQWRLQQQQQQQLLTLKGPAVSLLMAIVTAC
jgi:hypothetical protein